MRIPHKTLVGLKESESTFSPLKTKRISLLPIHCLFACSLLFGCANTENTTQATAVATQVPYEVKNTTYYPIPDASGYREKGIASWYGPDFHGRKTSNGEKYNMYEMTAAHKILPMNTMLLVKNLDNGLETIVRVNDRGPFVRGRIVDLSYSAAKKLKVVKPGTAKVEIIAVTKNDKTGTVTGSTKRAKPLQDFIHGEFYVQIGAFGNEQNASRLQKRFTDAGHTAVVQQKKGKKPLYLVHVYAGNEFAEAQKAEAALLEHGYSGAFIVAR